MSGNSTGRRRRVGDGDRRVDPGCGRFRRRGARGPRYERTLGPAASPSGPSGDARTTAARDTALRAHPLGVHPCSPWVGHNEHDGDVHQLVGLHRQWADLHRGDRRLGGTDGAGLTGEPVLLDMDRHRRRYRHQLAHPDRYRPGHLGRYNPTTSPGTRCSRQRRCPSATSHPAITCRPLSSRTHREHGRSPSMT